MKIQEIARTLKRELAVYQKVAAHPKTPRAAKWLLGLALAYALSPIDLIPDFLPIIGHLDDAIIVPGLVIWALKMVPSEVVDQCRQG